MADNSEAAVRRAGRTKGEIYAFSFTTTAYEEATGVMRKGEIKIKLIAIREVLEFLFSRRRTR